MEHKIIVENYCYKKITMYKNGRTREKELTNFIIEPLELIKDENGTFKVNKIRALVNNR